jgi:hypothetical protein
MPSQTSLLVPNPGQYNARMNKEWHERHVMPKNATLDERIAWHREHQKHCACRPIPPKLREQMGAGDVDPRFAPVVDAFAKDGQVTYGGKGFGATGLKVNGKIFAMFSKGKFVAKLPKERVNELVRLGKGEYFDPGHGRLMKEWVALGGATTSWVALAREAHDFVRGAKT